jgi:gamma-glutamyltranspeptidase/glutathione hydrolase
MDAGGNAVDAAIAANAVLGVVLPTACGIGGDLFALVHTPGAAAPHVLNASGRGGTGLDAAELRARGHAQVPPYSPWSVTVPGCVDGWEALAARHGKMPLRDLLQPAIRLAGGGFEASTELSAALDRLRPRIIDQGSAPPLYPAGEAPRPGTLLRRPGLAGTLDAIAERGRTAFYEGPVADAIADATHGVLSTDQLQASSVDWVEPIGIDVVGRRAWTVPPNSQGYLTLAAAWLLEQLHPPADPDDPAFHHAVIEAYRAVAWEREHTVADPRWAPLAPDELLDPGRLAPRLDALHPERTARWPTVDGIDGGTAYLCAVDAAGNGVSLIQSNFHGIGAGLSAGDTGVFLHNRGAGFSLIPGHPNEAAPGKRPLHTLSPTLWTEGGELCLLLGTRGGHQQPQYLLQTIAQLFVSGVSPAAAQEQPRWSMDHAAAETVSAVAAEVRMPEHVVAGLVARGHVVDLVPDWPPGWGPVSIITVRRDGSRRLAADPRIDTASAAMS